MTLTETLAVGRVRDNVFSASVPEGWLQGRGAFGGLPVGMMVNAAIAACADPARPPRSITAEIIGPVQPGAVELRTEMLRNGSGMATIAVRLVQANEVLAHAVVLLGKVRAPEITSLTWPAPDLSKPPRADETLDFPPPEFAQHFEVHSRGHLPFSGVKEPITEGWVRAKHAGANHAHAYVSAMADMWWPAVLCSLTSFRPIGTIAYTLQWHTLPSSDARLYHRGRTLAANDGYTTELRELWTEQGELVSVNTQCIVVIK